MKRAFCVLIALGAAAVCLQGQDVKQILDTFRRNFAVASMDVKIQILQDATARPDSTQLGPLYQQAVDFVLDNSSLIPSDPRFRQLAGLATDQIRIAKYTAAKYSVWSLFKADTDTQVLMKAAQALGALGAGDAEIIGGLNRYVETQNTLFASGKTPDLQVMMACFLALGAIGDSSSFAPLFSAVNLGYPEQVARVARETLLSIKGDFETLILAVIRSRPLSEKLLALQMALESDRLTDAQKAGISEAALDMGLHSSAADAPGRALLRDIRRLAAGGLRDRKWTEATPLAIAHLDMSIAEFDKALVDKGYLLEAIDALGSMSTHEAAVRLTQYLVLTNSYTDKGKGYDEQIVLAILDNLGILGDKVSFDDLVYTQYLNYPVSVKKAARAALERLKW